MGVVVVFFRGKSSVCPCLFSDACFCFGLVPSLWSQCRAACHPVFSSTRCLPLLYLHRHVPVLPPFEVCLTLAPLSPLYVWFSCVSCGCCPQAGTTPEAVGHPYHHEGGAQGPRGTLPSRTRATRRPPCPTALPRPCTPTRTTPTRATWVTTAVGPLRPWAAPTKGCTPLGAHLDGEAGALGPLECQTHTPRRTGPGSSQVRAPCPRLPPCRLCVSPPRPSPWAPYTTEEVA